MRFVYGFDFGTSNSGIAAWDCSKNALVTALRPMESTLLYYPDRGGVIVGNAARERYLADGMTGRLLQSIKSFFQDEDLLRTQIGGRWIDLIDMAESVITYFKKAMDDALCVNCRSVVIGRPAVNAPDEEGELRARNRLEAAARRAGFEEIWFQAEPVAAAFAYETRLSKEELAVVADLGGGTSDFTVMRARPGVEVDADRSRDLLGSAGVQVGGDDFDADLMWTKVTPLLGRGARYEDRGKLWDIPNQLHWAVCRWHEIPFLFTRHRHLYEEIKKLVDRTDKSAELRSLLEVFESNLGYSIFHSVEKAKISLSAQDSAKISYPRLRIETEVDRNEFAECTSRRVSKIERCVDSLLSGAGIEASSIGSVFLTGGSSQIPHVRACFADKFGNGKVRGGGTLTSVCDGLALAGAQLSGKCGSVAT